MAHQQNAGGPHVRWTPEQVTDELRAWFLRAIEETAPIVLDDLRDRVWPLYQKAAPAPCEIEGHLYPRYFPVDHWPADLRQAADEWAIRHYLIYRKWPCRWALAQAAQAMAHWLSHLEFLTHSPLRWNVSGAYSGIQKLDIDIAADLTVELPGAGMERSIHETDKEFTARAKHLPHVIGQPELDVRPQLDAISAKVAALPAMIRKRRPEHFTWLVRYQIRGETPQEIAAHAAATAGGSVAVDVPAVKSALRRLAREIQLTLRPFPVIGRPGRPRKP
jgi:hypothetical protein